MVAVSQESILSATTEILAQIKSTFAECAGAEYYGEPISQMQHAIQAADLAKLANADDELVLAAFFHDVGHFCFSDRVPMEELGVVEHELIGALYLYFLGFSERVASLVAGHVAAKRFLVSQKAEYHLNLSEASRRTLKLQGGSMSQQEVADFKAASASADWLRLRAWDEAAKKPGGEVVFPDYICELILAHLSPPCLTDSQLQTFTEQGYLHIPGWLPSLWLSQLTEDIARFSDSTDQAGKWMKYYERTDSGRQLCRLENFLQYSELMASLVNGPRILKLMTELLGESGVLFKEKINFKLPGGQGFAPHQDAPAFTSFGQQYHITAMLSLDATTPDNGCLEVCPGNWERDTLSLKQDLTLNDQVIAELDWLPLPTAAGDLVLFGSYLPHRSGPNSSAAARRALYATYNGVSEGAFRDQYFAEKRSVLPPDVERLPGVEYGKSSVFNVGNPVD